jgi:hypothetical protein
MEYHIPFDYILNEMSLANMVMYDAVLPSYDSENEKNEVIKADDPRNKERVHDILFG